LFGDLGTIPVSLFTLAVSGLLERVLVKLGKILEVWKIDESVERLEGFQAEVNLDIYFRRIEEPGIRRANEALQAPSHV
jgi:hypothetical protein